MLSTDRDIAHQVLLCVQHQRFGEFGYHGAIDLAEGAVWRIETQRSQKRW